MCLLLTFAMLLRWSHNYVEVICPIPTQRQIRVLHSYGDRGVDYFQTTKAKSAATQRLVEGNLVETERAFQV